MKKYVRYLPSLLIFLLILSAVLGGTAYAKYAKDFSITGSLQISASLGKIRVLQSPVQRNAMGEYTLNTSAPDTTDGQSYRLMPGVDIPVDAYVTVTEKTNVAAFIYLKVEHNLPLEGKLPLASCWTKLEEGLYIYATEAGTAIQMTENIDRIPIFRDDMLEISQDVSRSGDYSLKMTATMKQVVPGKTLTQIYEET